MRFTLVCPQILVEKQLHELTTRLPRTCTEPSFLAMWEEDVVVKKCRWILRQQEALSDRCSPLAARSVSDYISRPYQQAMLAREWETYECPTFSYALPACLSSE